MDPPCLMLRLLRQRRNNVLKPQTVSYKPVRKEVKIVERSSRGMSRCIVWSLTSQCRATRPLTSWPALVSAHTPRSCSCHECAVQQYMQLSEGQTVKPGTLSPGECDVLSGGLQHINLLPLPIFCMVMRISCNRGMRTTIQWLNGRGEIRRRAVESALVSLAELYTLHKR